LTRSIKKVFALREKMQQGGFFGGLDMIFYLWQTDRSARTMFRPAHLVDLSARAAQYPIQRLIIPAAAAESSFFSFIKEED
jgi:hypothetical protein